MHQKQTVIHIKINNLTFPPAAAFDARHKCCHRFIRRPRLQLVVRALSRFAFVALEIVGGRFQLNLVFVLVANALGFNEERPLFGAHLLVSHKRQVLRGDCLASDRVQNARGLQVGEHASRVVQVHLHHVRVVPFFHNVFSCGFLYNEIINTALHVACQHRRGSVVARILARQHALYFIAQINAKLRRIINDAHGCLFA